MNATLQCSYNIEELINYELELSLVSKNTDTILSEDITILNGLKKIINLYLYNIFRNSDKRREN